MKKGGILTPKQAAFVTEYLVDLNATAAAKRAGYSARTAGWIGPQLLVKSHIAAAVEAGKAARAERVQVTADDVVRELRRVAFGDLRGVMEWGPDGVRLKASEDLDADAAATLAEVSETTTQFGGSMKVKRHDKVKALELLGRHLGMFESDGPQINVNAGRGTTVRIVRETKRPEAAD